MIRYQIERFFLSCFGRILPKNSHTNLTRVNPESQGQSLCEKRLTKVHLGRGPSFTEAIESKYQVDTDIGGSWDSAQKSSHMVLSYCKPGNLGYRVPLILCGICYMIYPTRDRHFTRENKLYFRFAEKVTLKVTDVTPGVLSIWRALSVHSVSPKHIFLLSLRRPLKIVHGCYNLHTKAPPTS